MLDHEREYRVTKLGYNATLVGMGAMALHDAKMRDSIRTIMEGIRHERETTPLSNEDVFHLHLTDDEIQCILGVLIAAIHVDEGELFATYIRQLALVEWATLAPEQYTHLCETWDVPPEQFVPELQDAR